MKNTFSPTAKFVRTAILAVESGVVLCIELIWRTIQRLNPLLYSRRARIRLVTDGGRTEPGDKFAIFVIYCSGEIPGFTRSLIEALGRHAYNLAIVSNAPLPETSRTYLLERCRWLIERKNVGRDFGGYKDGIEFVLEHAPSARRLIVANDSVAYLEDGLDELIARLDSETQFTGVSEVFENYYHVASFLIAFGDRVIRSEAFASFWRNYRPISTRQWAIEKGEGALSAVLIAAGFAPIVLYRAQDLRPHLGARLPAQLPEVTGMLAAFCRKELRERWPAGNEAALAGASGKAEAADIPPAQSLTDDIVESILAHNQMHAAGLLFRRFLGMPILKRDLFYREAFPMDELESVIAGIPSPLREEVRESFLRRGDAADLGFAQRILHRHGAL